MVQRREWGAQGREGLLLPLQQRARAVVALAVSSAAVVAVGAVVFVIAVTASEAAVAEKAAG